MPARLSYIQNPVTLAERIDQFIAKHGSIRNAAKILEVDHSHLWRVKQGTKNPGKVLLFRLGLKRHVHYTVFRELT
jgi:hypothetical protein